MWPCQEAVNPWGTRVGLGGTIGEADPDVRLFGARLLLVGLSASQRRLVVAKGRRRRRRRQILKNRPLPIKPHGKIIGDGRFCLYLFVLACTCLSLKQRLFDSF